jgi:hypothetical protein
MRFLWEILGYIQLLAACQLILYGLAFLILLGLGSLFTPVQWEWIGVSVTVTLAGVLLLPRDFP